MAEPLIVLLTDFGSSDPYVGVMKGVIAARCPEARFIDLTHQVEPQNVKQAAYLLRSAYRYFPTHAVFLVVVDPGVGTARMPLAIKTDHGQYVGPDNGVFTGVLSEADTWQAVALWPAEQMSATFHGRDLFAPTAAKLACGATLGEVGSPTSDVTTLDLMRVTQIAADTIEGEVIHIDHFGNIITSLGRLDWAETHLRLDPLDLSFEAAKAAVEVDGTKINGIQATYGNVAAGALIALVNSDNQLEIAVNQGSAAKMLGAKLGQRVKLHF